MITGIFVENATARARNDRELAREEELAPDIDPQQNRALSDENMAVETIYLPWSYDMGWNHGGAILATAQTDVGYSCRRSSARS